MKKVLLVFLGSLVGLFGACDIVLDKKIFNICYSVKYKAPIVITMTLDKKVFDVNMKKRMNFKYDNEVDKNAQYSPKAFYGSGYDRGHIASDSSFDYSKDVLAETYEMTNVVAQKASFNRGSWKHLENYTRSLVIKYGKIKVTNYNYFNEKHKNNTFYYPYQMAKMIEHKNGNECYLFDNNDDKKNRKKDFSFAKIDCSKLNKDI